MGRPRTAIGTFTYVPAPNGRFKARKDAPGEHRTRKAVPEDEDRSGQHGCDVPESGPITDLVWQGQQHGQDHEDRDQTLPLPPGDVPNGFSGASD